MQQLFGILVLGLVMGVAGCATNVEKGDELAQQGKYEEAIKLYELVKSDDEEYEKARKGIANCNFQFGEIEFNGNNWEKAIALYQKAATPEAKERISACNFQLGEIEFKGENWRKAIALYQKAATPETKERISSCNFQLGEMEYTNANWEKAILLYSKSNIAEAEEKISDSKQQLEKQYIAKAKAAMDENSFEEAYVWWNKLNSQGKLYSKNIDAIEESLVKAAKESYSNRLYSKVTTLLASYKFISTRYANQARDLADKGRKWLDIKNKELTTLKRLSVNFANYKPGTILRLKARPQIGSTYTAAPFFSVSMLHASGASFFQQAGFLNTPESSLARRLRKQLGVEVHNAELMERLFQADEKKSKLVFTGVVCEIPQLPAFFSKQLVIIDVE